MSSDKMLARRLRSRVAELVAELEAEISMAEKMAVKMADVKPLQAMVGVAGSPLKPSYDSLEERIRRLERENYEMGVQVKSYERENAAYQKIIDSIGQACSR